MASVGYGYGGYGKSHFGTPVFQIGAATISATSGATATGRQIDRGQATISATSSVTAVGIQIDLGSATIAATSSATSAGVRIALGASTISSTSSMTATGHQKSSVPKTPFRSLFINRRLFRGESKRRKARCPR